jgi:hypothetical protein
LGLVERVEVFTRTSDLEREGGVSHSPLASARMNNERQEPKQVTPKGLEIPVPKRRDLTAAFKKLIQPVEKP